MKTFNAIELSIGLALLCLFMNQDLKKLEMLILLPNPDKINNLKWAGILSLVGCVFFITLFSINVLIEAVIHFHNVRTLEVPLGYFQITVFVFAIITCIWAFSVQKSYKLEANI